MKFFRFALLGMVAVLCLLGSCSAGEVEFEEPPAVEEETKVDESLPEEEGPSVDDSKPPETSSQNEDEEGEDGENPPIDETDEDDESEPYEGTGKLVLQINELCTEISDPRAEFIEFKILSAGNLGGLRVFIASNYENPLVYEFLPVEVKKGDYVVLHLRTLEKTCKDEYGENLDESGGTDSSSTARDFWIPGNVELLNKNDAVYVLDQDDNVLDAVMFVMNTGAATWSSISKQTLFPQVAEFLFNKGAWKSANGAIPVPSDAVDSSKTTVTRTICRDETAENTRTKADWYVTVTQGSTPGKENNTNRL